ncbi:MAG: hypothetical protein JWM47_4508 [Acidimicrobiales bacterium]|nr:hypothetical protein [Acidimicrobiales bacterium]
MTATCMIEVLTRRTFERASDEAFVPGQHEVRILDPRPHRDRADLAAILTYVDDQGRACDVLCFRYRDERGWKSIKVTRGTPKKYERTTAVGAPDLTGELLAVVEAAAEGMEPYPFEDPDEEEQSMRRLAHALMDEAERRSA